MLLLLMCGSTMTIWSTDPRADRLYECAIFSLTGWLVLKKSAPIDWRFGVPLAGVALWGFLQLAVNATVYRFATLQSALQIAALTATALSSYLILDSPGTKRHAMLALTWFGLVVSVVSVAAYYGSPGRILWVQDAPYPDTWGPFLSRNNFAQFLELCLPPALWLALTGPNKWLYGPVAAAIVAAGLVSASRAGALLLCGEIGLILTLIRTRDRHFVFGFTALAALFAAVAGVETLFGRFAQSNPWAERDQIYRSTLELIAQRPWQGYGLGTFASVYPEFAHFDSGFTIEHAHNDWLEWTATGGIGFAALWAVLTFRSLRKLWPWSVGVLAVFLHALVDFPFARLGVASWVFFLLGAIETNSAHSPQLLRRTT